ncbi:MAG: hypothetical protein AAGA56_08840 [Myxococcota bacterium]
MKMFGGRLVVVLLGWGVVGCAASPEGEWRSEQILGNGEENEMSLEADGRGDATLWAVRTGDMAFTEFEFDLEWSEQSDRTYEIDMECDEGPCDEGRNDFEMECDFINTDDGERLDCEGDERWSGVVLQWERVP